MVDYTTVKGKEVYAPTNIKLVKEPMLGPKGRLRAKRIENKIRATHPSSPLLGMPIKHAVRWGKYFDIEPELVLAIAGQETQYGTTGEGPSRKNPFGYGPFWKFKSWNDAIYRVTRSLRMYYLNEGYDTISKIGSKYSPVGAANDPRNLNAHWIDGVDSIYSYLGGSKLLRWM